MTKLVIFDLDQTLVDLLSVQDRAISGAFRKVFGVNARFSEVDFAGRQLPDLVVELAGLKGISKTEAVKRFFEVRNAYRDSFRRVVPKSLKPLPGVKDLLHRLKLAGVKCAVYTGGSGSVARDILHRAGLALAVYPIVTSDDSKKRSEMIRIAIKKVKRKSERLPVRDVFVVGDSVHDVKAAKSVGARSLAVLTGPHSRKRLLSARPDYIFKNLAVKGVLEALV